MYLLARKDGIYYLSTQFLLIIFSQFRWLIDLKHDTFSKTFNAIYYTFFILFKFKYLIPSSNYLDFCVNHWMISGPCIMFNRKNLLTKILEATNLRYFL